MNLISALTLTSTLTCGAGGGFASAQDAPGGGASSWKAGVAVGPFLPSNWSGVTEIMKPLQLRLSYFDDIFGVEMWGLRVAEDGAVLNIGGGSLVKGLKMESVPEVTVLVTVGLQAAYYRGTPVDGVVRPFARSSGIHMGGGILIPLNSRLILRGGSTILNGPGRSVMVEIGFEWSFGDIPNAAPRETPGSANPAAPQP
ncbi:MAG: hypothetical protein AB7G93_21915 [Bdellovibrionales bacterium]